MEHINYTPQKGESILIANSKTNFDINRIRIFSHIDKGTGHFACFNDSRSLTERLSSRLTNWRYCKRLKGEFHINFKPTNVLLNYNQY